MKKILTLCIVQDHPRVLLGMKKRGFGEGRWNGFGGKVDEGETIEAAALRELSEECGIAAKQMEKAGVLDFAFENEQKELEVHVFRVTAFAGEPMESEEMRPEWFHADEIPFDEMWPDDKYWLPMLLAGKKFKGRFLFDKPSSPEHSAAILEERLEEVLAL